MQKNLKTENHNGDFTLELDRRSRLTFRTTDSFYVIAGYNGEEGGAVVAPNNTGDRYAQLEFERGTVVTVKTEGMTTVVYADLPERNEHPDPRSMCEVVDDAQLSLYDRLKADMMSAISAYADAKGLDTPEEDEMLDFIEDDNLILTPYEYQAVTEEYVANNYADTVPTVSEQNNTPATETPTSSEQPASTPAE